MTPTAVSPNAEHAVGFLRQADVVVGIPSFNNAKTIGHVVRAVQAGLAKFFPQRTAVIVNSDGGSTDGTRHEVLSANLEDQHLLLLSTPASAAQRLSVPYHGIPGKGSAFRLIFEIAQRLDAKACVVVDADLRSISPEWTDHLLRPVLQAHYDLVTPYYHRHKFDGTITNNIVYPLTRSLYGSIVRQPIGGEFGISRKLFQRYLRRTDWETDVARYGIDIWMTTIALAEEFRVCQSFLGAKLHDPKDPGADLSDMLKQVVGSVFTLMLEYEPVWRARSGSHPTELFGFRFDVGVEPVAVRLEPMIEAFRTGFRDLEEIWRSALGPKTFEGVRCLAHGSRGSPDSFRFSDPLWTDTVIDFACAFHRSRLNRSHTLASFTPLYLGRVASMILAFEPLTAPEVENEIEQLCLQFERAKPRLLARWNDNTATKTTTEEDKETTP